MFTYFLSVSDAEPDRAVAVLKSLGPKETTMGMTAAERLINRGRAEGEARGRAEALLRLLRVRFPEQVDAPLEARVRAADIPTLDRWTERAALAPALQPIFD